MFVFANQKKRQHNRNGLFEPIIPLDIKFCKHFPNFCSFTFDRISRPMNLHIKCNANRFIHFWLLLMKHGSYRIGCYTCSYSKENKLTIFLYSCLLSYILFAIFSFLLYFGNNFTIFNQIELNFPSLFYSFIFISS